MTRVPPSQHIREAIAALLAEGQAGEGDVASTLIRLGAQRVVQELLEQEVTDHLERGHYARAEPTEAIAGIGMGTNNGSSARQKARFRSGGRKSATSPSPLRAGCGDSCGVTPMSWNGWV